MGKFENLKDNLEFTKDLILDYKKTTGLLLLSLVIFSCYSVWWVNNRAGLLYNCMVAQSDLQRDTTFRQLTGNCLVNEGTEEKPRYIMTSRLLGVGADGIDDTNVE